MVPHAMQKQTQTYSLQLILYEFNNALSIQIRKTPVSSTTRNYCVHNSSGLDPSSSTHRAVRVFVNYFRQRVKNKNNFRPCLLSSNLIAHISNQSLLLCFFYLMYTRLDYPFIGILSTFVHG